MNKKLFYILNLTWGLPMTLIGAIAALGLLVKGYRPTRHRGCLCFTVKPQKAWSGVSLGLVMIVTEQAKDATKNHEFGHAIQNAVYGPAHVLVSIASGVRCWYRSTQDPATLPPYDAVWFERQATEWGNLIIKDFLRS